MIFKLKEARKIRNITQKKLAELTEITQDRISKYENGQEMTVSNLIKICKALNVNPDFILGFSHEIKEIKTHNSINLAKNLDKDEILKIRETLQKSANYFQELIEQNTE